MRSKDLWKCLRENWKVEEAETSAANTLEEAGDTEVGTGTGTEVDMKETPEMKETTYMKPPDLFHWKKVMALAQAALREEHLVEGSTLQAVVLIPEGGGDYCGIGLV